MKRCIRRTWVNIIMEPNHLNCLEIMNIVSRHHCDIDNAFLGNIHNVIISYIPKVYECSKFYL